MARFAFTAIASYFLACSQLTAIETMPWYPRQLEFQSLTSLSYSHAGCIDVGGSSHNYSADNLFFCQSLSLAYERWAFEVEALFAKTSERRFGADSLLANVRYQLLDDVQGDVVSLTFGMAASTVFAPALRDYNIFHSGAIEGMVHVTVGKELIEGFRDWSLRGWLFSAVGVADHGSPFLLFLAGLEKKLCDNHTLRLFTNYRHGLGGNNLNLCNHFHGYGSIAYRAFDLALRLSHSFDISGELMVEFSRRLYARNCPKSVNTFRLLYLYPFSL